MFINSELIDCLRELGFTSGKKQNGVWTYRKDTKLLYVAYWGSYSDGSVYYTSDNDNNYELVCIENRTTGEISRTTGSIEELKKIFEIEERNSKLEKILGE